MINSTELNDYFQFIFEGMQNFKIETIHSGVLFSDIYIKQG